MAEATWAIYEKQVLRLLEPLDLHDGQKVRIQVVYVEPDGEPDRVQEEPSAYVVAEQALEAGQEAKGSIEALLQRLIEEGRMRPRPPGPVPPDPVPEEERLELADLMGQAPGKPLSEIVLEERGER